MFGCTCHHCTLLRPAKKDANFCLKILICILNVLLTPVLLLYHAFDAYIRPCCFSSTRCCLVMSSYCCGAESFCASCCNYTDSDFKPDANSLGNIQYKASGVRWIRIPDLVVQGTKHKHPVLFDKTIEAADVCQGKLGDCWLLAAFATLCEKKAFIQNCFITRTYNPFGKYIVRLYNREKKRFYYVTVDDYVPCDAAGTPLFTRFNGHEMWPLLLEKAYAKSKGSYAKIEGGSPLVAMMELTGYLGDCWGAPFDDAKFNKMKHANQKGCLLTAGTHGVDNTRLTGRDASRSTIVSGHAYSILDIKEPHLTTAKVRLIKLRNPWGGGEWTGDWSDDSPLWKSHPGVALEIGKPEVKEDGIFYMSWEDFKVKFSSVDVLYPNYGMDNIHYRVVEEDPICGNCRGCAWGCFKYWVCCKGLRTLWFERSSAELKAQVARDDGHFHMLSIV